MDKAQRHIPLIQLKDADQSISDLCYLTQTDKSNTFLRMGIMILHSRSGSSQETPG